MILSLLVALTLVPGQADRVAPAASGPRLDDSSPVAPDSGKTSAGENKSAPAPSAPGCFPKRFAKEYPLLVEWFPTWLGKDEKKDENADDMPPFRRALPSPWDAPFPGNEYQGPTIGVPPSSDVFPLMKAIYGGPWGEEIKESRVKVYGWLTASGNWSTSKNSNTPTSYWIAPNRYELDQGVLAIEREVNTAQCDHIDWGFNFTQFYGIDYRYTTSGGYFSEQLLKHNQLYGYDPLIMYLDLYLPGVAQGLLVRVGRYISPPDIEAQLAPGNYMGSHSILFTYDAYTQTGVLVSVKLNDQWTVQAGINAGNDMAPWYPGATPTGLLGVRWVSRDNNDSVYAVANSLNDAQFRRFVENGQPSGHDNFDYVVATWTHRFSKTIHTATEAYYLWQFNAVVGGTPSLGPLQPYGGGGGIGAPIPGNSDAYGAVNYTMFQLSKKDFFTVRNELWKDDRGERTGFATLYSSHTIGLTHNFSATFQVRPEIGYYHSYDVPAFDLGTKKNQVEYGFDATLRF